MEKFCFVKPRGDVTQAVHTNATDVETPDQSARDGERVPVYVLGHQLPTYSDLFPSLTAENDKS